MSLDGPTSPDDPEWVDEIVRRALERAGADDPSAAPVAPPSAQQPAPQAPEPRPAPQQAQPSEPVQPTGAQAQQPPAQAPPTQQTPPTQPVTPQHEVRRPAGDVVQPSIEAQPAQPRLPTEDDLVSAYPISDHAQPDHIAGTRPAPQRAAQGTMPYPDDGFDQDRFDQDRFDEALGAEFAEPASDDPISGRMRGFLEWGAVVVGALAVALLIKTFLMQAYFIPSGSMEPTLQIGDRVLVNKLSYDFGDIGRGDLVVFNRPPNQPDGEDDLIKRVIALPGETIEIRDGQVFITTVDNPNQQRLEEPYLAEGVSTTGLVNTQACVNATATSCTIPDGFVFVMGDNRPGSRDSRVFGPISEDLVVGRAFLRVWPLGDVGFL